LHTNELPNEEYGTVKLLRTGHSENRTSLNNGQFVKSLLNNSLQNKSHKPTSPLIWPFFSCPSAGQFRGVSLYTYYMYTGTDLGIFSRGDGLNVLSEKLPCIRSLFPGWGGGTLYTTLQYFLLFYCPPPPPQAVHSTSQ
jgi:hypothetical protein